MESGGSSRTPRSDAFIQEDDSIDSRESFKQTTDEYMPIANVTRIMRHALPPHTKISNDAKKAMQECVSKFIKFVTSEANKKCHGEYRMTISADDLIAAMGSVGLDSYIEPLTAYLDMHRAQNLERPHHVPYARWGQPLAMLPSQMGRYPMSNRGDGEGSSDEGEI